MTGTNCDLFTHNQSRSYLNHLVTCRTGNKVRRIKQTPKRAVFRLPIHAEVKDILAEIMTSRHKIVTHLPCGILRFQDSNR